MGISSNEMYTIYDSTKECETNLSTFIIISANELNSIRASCMVFWDWNGNQNIPKYFRILLKGIFSLYYVFSFLNLFWKILIDLNFCKKREISFQTIMLLFLFFDTITIFIIYCEINLGTFFHSILYEKWRRKKCQKMPINSLVEGVTFNVAKKVIIKTFNDTET